MSKDPFKDLNDPEHNEFALSDDSQSDTEGRDITEIVKSLRKQIKLLKPIKVLFDLAYAFSGSCEEKPDDYKPKPQHLMGGLTKYLFSQKPSIAFIRQLEQSFITEDKFKTAKRHMESFDEAKRQMRDTISKLGNKVCDSEANLSEVD